MAYSTAGAINITNSGAITADGEINASGELPVVVGIAALARGAGNVAVSSTQATPNAFTISAYMEGILATSVGGNVGVTNNAAIVNNAASGASGIKAATNGAGAVVVSNAGNVTASLNGVETSAVNGATSITNSGGVITTSTGAGVKSASTGGSITVTTGDATVSGKNTKINAQNIGVSAILAGGADGVVSVTNYGVSYGTSTGGVFAITGNGVTATNSASPLLASTENLSVANYGTIRALGAGATGVLATSSGGSVRVGNYSNHTIAAAGIGIDASALGAVTIINGDLVGPNPDGAITSGQQGIRAVSTGVGDVQVANGANASINAGSAGVYDGIEAATSGAGRVTIQSAGTITATGNGVNVTAAVGNGGLASVISNANTINAGLTAIKSTVTTGDISIANSGLITAAAGDGVQANTTTGAIGVANSGAIVSQTASAIRIQNSGSAASTILNDAGGTLRGAGSSTSSAVISVNNAGTSPTTITNRGDIRSNRGAPGDLADYAMASATPAFGAMTINNSNMIRGRMALTEAADSFSNLAGAAWETTGLNSFGNGANTFSNAAGAQVQAWGTTTFDMGASAGNVVDNGGLIQLRNGADGTPATTNFAAAIPSAMLFNNSGLIDLSQDGSNLVSNRVNIQGSFVSSGNSRIAVNTQLGGVGSVSDRVFIDGNSSGTGTGIIVRDTVGGVGDANPVGIAVVGVKGANAPTDFTLNSASDHYKVRNGQPVLDKGLYFYYMGQTPTSTGCSNGYTCYSLFSAPTTAARSLPIAVTVSQDLWQEDWLMWEDRQVELRDEMLMRKDQAALGQSPACADATRRRNDAVGVSVNPRQDPQVACAGDAKRRYSDGGVSTWVKSIGSWANRNNAITGWGGGGRALSYDLGYRQNVFSMLGGADFIKKGVFSSEDFLIAGVMGGYLQSNVKFNQESGNLLGPTRFNYQGGTLGGSLTYMNHGFFVDGLLKVDLLSSNLYIPVPGLTNATAGVRVAGGVGNLGYRYDWGQFFIEPMAAFTYAAVDMGSIKSPANNLTMNFGGGNDFRGGFGGRLGFVTPSPYTNHLVEASFTGRYWSIFDANRGRTTDILSGDVSETIGDYTYGRDYGEVKGNLNIHSIGAGWSTFINTGLRWNAQWASITTKGGVAYRW